MFHVCGGCSLQHLGYEAQIDQKGSLFVRENRSLVDRLPSIESLKFHRAPWVYHYRNKMEFTFIQHKGGDKNLGLHEQDRFQSVLSLSTLDTASING